MFNKVKKGVEPYKTIPDEYYCKGWFCKLFSHYLNPFGNWNEPLPYPEKRKIQADNQWLPNAIWWNLRNPFHNFNHYWIGIVPRGDRYEWYSPEDNGWVRDSGDEDDPSKTIFVSWWRKSGKMSLPIFKFRIGPMEGYIGWMSRGNFGMAFRKN